RPTTTIASNARETLIRVYCTASRKGENVIRTTAFLAAWLGLASAALAQPAEESRSAPPPAPVKEHSSSAAKSSGGYQTYQSSSGGAGASNWSLVSAETMGTNRTALHFEAGYPGISAAILSGRSETFDLGGRFSFLYASEAISTVAPGLRLQALLRFAL